MHQKKDYQTNIDTFDGKYVNYFKIGHNDDVFVFDYYQIFPESDDDESHLKLLKSPKCRIILSPSDVKQLLLHIETAIKEYESVKRKSKKSAINIHDNR